MTTDERNQGQGEPANPRPQGQNIPGQPMADQGKPTPGRDAGAPDGASEYAKDPDLTNEELAEEDLGPEQQEQAAE